MPTRMLDGVYFVSKPPVIEFEGGLFKVCYEIGRHTVLEVVMPPTVFARARLLGAEACAKWLVDQAPTDNITSLRGGKR